MTNMHAPLSRRPTLLRSIFAAAVSFLIALVLPAGVASAHTSFEESSPANGDTLSEPVSTIVLQFSGESEYGDDGFTVLTPDGQVRTPNTVSSPDQKVFELTFDPPLAGGEVGVRWAVNAPDAHPIDGAFSFEVTAAAAAASAVPDGAQSGETDTGDPALTATGDNTADPMVMTDAAAEEPPSASMSLDEFLAEPPARGGEGIARWGRLLGFAAITLLIGGVAFAATTFRGRRAEIDRAIGILRILGAALAVGALLEYVGVARIAEASIMGYWSSQPGMATLLRAAGGIAIAAGLAVVTVPVRAPRPAHPLSAAVNPTMEYEREELAEFWSEDHGPRRRRRHVDVGLDNVEPAPSATATTVDPLLRRRQPASGSDASQRSVTISTSPPPRQPRVANRDTPKTRRSETRPAEPPVIRRWVPDRSSSAAYVGVAVAVISFWFDGHTVSKGVRPLHAVVNSVHVVAGSVWLGGVVAMAVVLWSRHRAGVAPRALEMVVRFSGIATVALGAVIAAGGIMAFLVLDSVGELFSTQWGQVLLLKSAAAGLAMLGGAYNHFRLLPALEADPDDPTLITHLRSAVTSEAIMLGFVIVVTASLVAAAS
jgi:copper transport protein